MASGPRGPGSRATALQIPGVSFVVLCILFTIEYNVKGTPLKLDNVRYAQASVFLLRCVWLPFQRSPLPHDPRSLLGLQTLHLHPTIRKNDEDDTASFYRHFLQVSY